MLWDKESASSPADHRLGFLEVLVTLIYLLSGEEHVWLVKQRAVCQHHKILSCPWSSGSGERGREQSNHHKQFVTRNCYEDGKRRQCGGGRVQPCISGEGLMEENWILSEERTFKRDLTCRKELPRRQCRGKADRQKRPSGRNESNTFKQQKGKQCG